MTTTATKNFLGIPVSGDSYGESQVDQRPIEEFAPLLQPVLSDQSVTAFGWRQYTPYFNDGDPCIFHAYGLWVRTSDTPVEGSLDGYDEDDTEPWMVDSSYHPTLGYIPRKYDRSLGEHVESGPYGGTSETRYRNCYALDRAIDSRAFNNVLLEAFGDHALITVTREGIQVETYEHD